MSVHSFHVFDRHAECIYSKYWDQKPQPIVHDPARRSSNISALGNAPARVPGVQRRLISSADDAKLIFGVVFSLKRMVRTLGGQEDSFLSYRTGEYKLHYYETPTNLKFVMITDIRIGNMRTVMHQIWANLYVEYVVKNPIAPVEHAGGVGVANELFEEGLQTFLNSIFSPQT